jgi:hypothetical protein
MDADYCVEVGEAVAKRRIPSTPIKAACLAPLNQGILMQEAALLALMIGPLGF